MRRRTMVQAALAAALVGALARPVSAPGGEINGKLPALAATVVPVKDHMFWIDSPGARNLRERFDNQDSTERERSLVALGRLDAAAGGSFAALGPDQRASMLALMIEKDAEFAEAFDRIRAMVLDVYFTGGAGLVFTGYRHTTQFEGYPEYLSMSTGWE